MTSLSGYAFLSHFAGKSRVFFDTSLSQEDTDFSIPRQLQFPEL